MRARIESCSGSTGALQELTLTLPPDFRFRAGQYLEIEVGDDCRIPLSIASAPHRLPELHLHYRSTPGVRDAALLDGALASGEDLAIHGPFGDVCLANPLTGPLLIIAGGTGGGQALGLLDELLVDSPSQPVCLLWCADSSEELYRPDWLQSLGCPWLTVQCIADARRTPANRAMRWLRDHAPEYAAARIILSGSPGFVHAAVEVLQAAGVSRTLMESDVFAYFSDRGQPPDTA